MPLTDAQRDYLRVLGHSLEPTLDVGAGGVTTSLAKQLERALTEVELVKVRLRFGDRDKRSRVAAQLAPLADVCLVQQCGNFALLYRPRADSALEFPTGDA